MIFLVLHNFLIKLLKGLMSEFIQYEQSATINPEVSYS